MDLHIVIRDENGRVLGKTNVYQNGSDSEGTEKILNYISETFDIDDSAWANPQEDI